MDKNLTKQFGLDTPIKGMDAVKYMASLIESNEKKDIEIERGKLSVAILKQMNNRSRLLIDAAKYELKRNEAECLEKAKAEA
jgi:hypothetical protein